MNISIKPVRLLAILALASAAHAQQSRRVPAPLQPLNPEDSASVRAVVGCYAAAYVWPDSVAGWHTKLPRHIQLLRQRLPEDMGNFRPAFRVAGRVATWTDFYAWKPAAAESLRIVSAGRMSGYRVDLARDRTGFHGAINFVLDLGPVHHAGEARLVRVPCKAQQSPSTRGLTGR